VIGSIVALFFSTILQNASFTLVSRARQTKSLWFHGIASVCSNGVWLLVIRQVVTHLDSPILMMTYLVASVTGSLLMHHVSMNYLEKRFKQ
jgi:hypothetical protein